MVTRFLSEGSLSPFRASTPETGCPPSGSPLVERISPPEIRGYVPAFDGVPEWKRRAVECRDIPPNNVPYPEKIRVTLHRVTAPP
jgi:hypothetical protein